MPCPNATRRPYLPGPTPAPGTRDTSSARHPPDHVEPLRGLAPDGVRPPEVPLEVGEPGRLRRGPDEPGVVQDDVEIDLDVEPGRRCAGSRPRRAGPAPAGRRSASGRTSAARAAGSSDCARWISEYQASTAPTRRRWSAASAGAGRPPRSCRPGTAGAPRRPSRARGRSRGSGTPSGQVRRDVAGPAADLHDRLAVPAWAATRSSSQRSNGRSSSSSARPSAYGSATASYAGRTRSSRASAPSAMHASAVDAPIGAAAATAADRPSRCTHRASCCPGRRSSSPHQRRPRARHPSQDRPRPRRGPRRRAAVRCGCAAHPAPAARAAAAP